MLEIGVIHALYDEVPNVLYTEVQVLINMLHSSIILKLPWAPQIQDIT